MKPLPSLLSASTRRPAQSAAVRAKRRRPLLELLEDRTVPTAIVPPSGIVSWWTGDNTAADLVGANNGTLTNGAGYAAGNVAGAFNFDGVDDYVQAASTGLPVGNADRTLELWVKADSFSPSSEAFFAGYGNFGSNNQTYHLGTSGSNLFWSQWGTGIGGPTLVPGQWYHVAVTNVGNTATLYLNGAAVGTNTVTISTPANSPFYIGRIPGTLGDIRKLDGVVDEVTVYNRALSAAEIHDIYLAGSDGKIKGPYFTADKPFVAEPADAGSTSTVTFTIRRVGSGPASVDWTTADGTATAGADYVAAAGHLDFAAGETQKTVQVTINGDDTTEPSETFQLVLSTTTPGYAVSGGVARITDGGLAVTVSDATALEGGNTYRYTDAFVAPDAYGLAAGRNIVVGPDGNVYVASHDNDVVKVFEGGTGRFLRDLSTPGGELDGPWPILFGPDGYLYAGGRYSDNIVRFDVGTGASSVFVATAFGGLGSPKAFAFDPAGNLYVSSTVVGDRTKDTVKRYSATGAYLGDFVTAGSGGLNGAVGIGFGPDGNLYLSSQGTQEIKRYNGQTGAFLNTFVPAGSGGIASPTQILFPGDGYLYVCDNNFPRVYRYSATTGAFVDLFATGPTGTASSAAFGPSGEFYVSLGTPTLQTGSAVGRFAASSIAAFGVSLSAPSSSPVTVSYTTAGGTATAGSDFTAAAGTLTFAPGQTTQVVFVQTLNDALVEGTETFSLNLSGAVGATITDATGVGTILDDAPSVSVNDVSLVEGNAGTTTATFTVSLSAPSAHTVTVNYATADGTATVANNDYVAASNTLTFLPGETSKTVSVTVKGDTAAEANETFFVNLSGPTGAVVADAQGVGTIRDDDGTKFFVVDDASTDRTYRYTLPGASLGNSALNSGNTAPRGAASNLAGDKVWVVDVNKKVYVYNATGGLLGSWTANGLPSNAQVEGIAVAPNGTDVWIIDDRQDKVFKYAGAGSLLTGSMNATSSFSLDAENAKPRDIVTDGNAFWVINVSNTYHKVFKYTLSGGLLGSWAFINGGGGPTGITLDPSAPSALWIVDSNTDRVYQYDNAVNRTYGQQEANASFALAAGNTNPQGIADPPPPDMLLTPAAAPPALGPPANAPVSGGLPIVAMVPSLSSRDAVFALLYAESLPGPGASPVDHLAGGADTSHRETLVRAADRAWTAAGSSVGQNPLDLVAQLTPGSSRGLRLERSALDLLDGALIGEESPASAAEFFTAALAKDTAPRD